LKKYFILILSGLNLSCAALMNGQEQSVNLIDAKFNIYETTCSGLAESIGTCYQKANRTCGRGYKALDERIDSSGVHRQLRFQCK
jgi:hypothetical protein